MRSSNIFILFLSLLCTSGCTAKNRAISPPNENQWVDIEIKAPNNTEAFPIVAFYTSDECKKERYNVDMKLYQLKGTQARNINMEIDKASGNYRSQIPMDGGGQCKWRLSKVTLGIQYSRIGHLIKNGGGQIGTAVGIEVAFDDEGAKNGDYILTTSPLSLTPTYYPIITKKYLPSEITQLSLLGKEVFESYRINVINDENIGIKLSPILDESKVVKKIGPKSIGVGNFFHIEYPDGSVTSNGEVTPDFEKLSSM
ncbi:MULTISPECIES: hypothetical protein [Yersinia]|uniref:Lipoprotein n=1 Tax=Yersinia frederiksenii TaxID=29484 RepID=A0AAI8ZUV9_YERFR|nr:MULTISPECIES: hypothetical protein [Yersinia]MDN0127459.1 hypothetical protein [Yersinia massiliensis]CFR13957.1 Uncharacterised protein [Yersinia frederiksenii]